MNWMNGLCMLIGLGLGMEIMWCVMKYRYDNVADNIKKLHIDLNAAMEKNTELINKWGVTIEHWNDTINLNGRLIDIIDSADGRKEAADND